MTDQRDQRNLQIRMDKETFSMLEALAKEKGLGWTPYLRVMIREAFRKWEGEKRSKNYG